MKNIISLIKMANVMKIKRHLNSTHFTIPKFIFAALFAMIILTGCNEEDKITSLWNGDYTASPAPVITSLAPANQGLAGVTAITIIGENFSEIKENNLVFFNGYKASVLEASPTRIIIRAPQIVSDSLIIKIAVHGSLYFSEGHSYKLKPSVEEYYSFDTQLGEIPWGVTLDALGNLYVSLEGKNISKIKTDKSMSVWAPKGIETKWNSLQFGPNSTIYGAKLLRGIWKITENTAPTNAPWVTSPSGSSISDMDFDNALNLWAVGTNSNLTNNSIVVMKPDGTLKPYSFPNKLTTVRYYNSYLYFSGLIDGKESVWRAIVVNDSLGTPELYFNYSDNVHPSSTINALTFAEDGDLYIATNKTEDPVTIVHLDGSFEPLYPGNFEPNTNIVTMCWGNDEILFMTRAEYSVGGVIKLKQTILAVNMEKRGAIYHGRN